MEEGHAIPLTSVYVPCSNFSSTVAAFASFFLTSYSIHFILNVGAFLLIFHEAFYLCLI